MREENINLTIKEQKLEELQERLNLELELNKKINEEIVRIQEEKQNVPEINNENDEIAENSRKAIIQKCDSGEGREENSKGFCSHTDYREKEGKKESLLTEDILEDVQLFEKSFNSETDTTVSQDKDHHGISPSKPCVGKHVITQQTGNGTDHRKPAAMEIKDKLDLEKDSEHTEFKSPTNPFLVEDTSMETGKMHLQGVELSGLHRAVVCLYSKDQSPSPDSAVRETALNRDHNKDASENIPSEQQLRSHPRTKCVFTNQSKPGLDSSLDAKMTPIQDKKYSLQSSSSARLSDKQCKIKQPQTLNKISECHTLPFKPALSLQQVWADTPEKPELALPCDVVVSHPMSPATFGENSKVLMSSDNIGVGSMLVTPNSNSGERILWEDQSDMQRSQLQNCLAYLGNSETPCPPPINSGKSQASPDADLKTSTGQFCNKRETDGGQKTEAPEDGHFLFMAVNERQHTLLKNTERTMSLHDIISGKMYREGQLEKSHSFHVKPSGESVNRTGRASFELPSSEKKTEKTTPTYMHLLDPGPGSEVNHTAGPTVSTSTPTTPVLLKERLADTACITRVADAPSNWSSRPGPERTPSEERNAIAKTFGDSPFPTEHVKAEPLVPTVLQSHFQSVKTKEPAILTAAPAEDNWQSRVTETEKHLSSENDNQPKKRKAEEMLGNTQLN